MNKDEKNGGLNSSVAAAYLFCVILPVVLDIGFGWRHISDIMYGYLSDPDSYMRLLRIRQGLNHDTLFNYVMRDDSGHRLVIEWSRLYDGVIVLMASPLMIFMPVMQAVKIAGILATPLWSGLTALAIAYGMQPFCKNKMALWTAGLCIAIMPGIFRINAIGSIQYHIFIACVLTWSLAFSARTIWKQKEKKEIQASPFIAGVLGGLAIWAMPETWPFLLCSYAIMVWIDNPNVEDDYIPGKWAFGFMVMTFLGLMIDPPYMAIEYDRISVVYLWLASLVFFGSVVRVLIKINFNILIERIFLFVVTMSFCLAWFVIWPNIIRGPWGLTNAHDFKLFFGSAIEMLPPTNIWMALSLSAPAFWAAGYCLWLVVKGARSNNWNTIGAASIGWIACLFAAGLTLRFQLFSDFSAIAGAAIIPLLMDRGISKGNTSSGAITRIAVGFLGTMPLLVLLPMAAFSKPVHQKAHSYPVKDCRVTPGAAKLIDKAGKSIVLAPIDQVPAIIYETKTTGVGSIYQHGISHYVAAVEAWQDKSHGKTVPESILTTKASFIAFCPDVSPPGAGPDTLWGQLENNHTPSWMKLVGTSGNWRLYRIKK